jgi:hypothetical protein
MTNRPFTGSNMTDASPTEPTSLALGAAAFLAQALGLPDSPETIATELSNVREDTIAGIYSLELDSSIGVAAFLIYAYALRKLDAEGTSGEKLYSEGLTILQQATEQDTPGPRMVAHADTSTMGFILATSPATWRALQGEKQTPLVATAAEMSPSSLPDRERASLAEDLHRSLKSTNDQARAWLAAIRSAGAIEDGKILSFTEEETALALFVLDSTNVESTLTALNLLVASAREQAGKVITRSQAAAPEGADTRGS